MNSGKEMTNFFPDLTLKWRVLWNKTHTGPKQMGWGHVIPPVSLPWCSWERDTSVFNNMGHLVVLLLPVVTHVQVGKMVLCSVSEVTLHWVSGGILPFPATYQFSQRNLLRSSFYAKGVGAFKSSAANTKKTGAIGDIRWEIRNPDFLKQ